MRTSYFLYSLLLLPHALANSGIVSAVTDVAQPLDVIQSISAAHDGNPSRFRRAEPSTDNTSDNGRDNSNAEERTFTDPGIVKHLGLFQSWMKYGETRKSVYDLLDLKGVVWKGWRTRKFDKMRGNTEYQKSLNYEKFLKLMKINEPEQYAKYKELVRKNKAITKELASKRAAAVAANAAV